MSKKKIMVLVTSALFTVGVVGTTLALFTSNDKVTNNFQTIEDENNNGDAGIDIWENFDVEKANKVLPGITVTKLVKVQNTAKYSQLLKVEIKPSLKIAKKDQDGKLVYEEGNFADAVTMDIDSVELSTVADKDGIIDPEKLGDKYWVHVKDNIYYYAGRLKAGSFTTPLLKSATFKEGLGNEYKNAKFDIQVVADSTQSNVTYNDDWKVLNRFVDADNYDESDQGINSIGAKEDGTVPSQEDENGVDVMQNGK